jgi:hypothetical protein
MPGSGALGAKIHIRGSCQILGLLMVHGGIQTGDLYSGLMPDIRIAHDYPLWGRRTAGKNRKRLP